MYRIREEELRKAYVEVLEVFKIIPKEQYNKIPQKAIDFMSDNKNRFYKFKLESLNQLSREAGIIIVDLYMTYVADDKNKKLMSEILKLNDLKKTVDLT